MKFVIKGRLDGLNEYVKACRTSYHLANNMKIKNQNIVLQAVHEAKVKPIVNYPCQLKIAWYEPNSRRDIDNIRMAVKFILDALVSQCYLIDDSQKYVNGISDSVMIDRNNPRIEIEILESGNR